MSRNALAVSRPFAAVPGRGILARLATLTRRPLDRPGLLLAATSAVVTPLVFAQVYDTGGLSWLAEDLHLVVASGGAVLAVAVMARRPGPRLLDYHRLALALVAIWCGLVGVALVPIAGPVAVFAADTFILAGAALALPVVMPALFRTSDRRARTGWMLDSLIMTGAITTVVVTVWRSVLDAEAPLDQFFVPAIAASLLASTAMPVIAALSRKIRLQAAGIWCAVAAAALLSWCWVFWIDSTLHGRPHGELLTISCSAGMILLAWAWVSWSEDSSDARFYATVAQRLTDVLPAGSVIVCVAIAAVPHANIGPIDPAYVGTLVVVLLTLLRQRGLRLSERESAALLAREVGERSQTMITLSRLESADTLEATALQICYEAMRLDGITAAAVYAFGSNESAVPLALAGLKPASESVGEPVERARGLHLRACADGGAWVDKPLGAVAGRAEAFAPMRWDDRVVGVVAVSATEDESVRRLPERLSTLSEFGVVSAALMGPMLAKHWRMADLRSQLDNLIAMRSFWPVFQSVVRLTDRQAVGYEALTRFADGSRPDERFAQANAAGMTVRFEVACLRAQLEAASWLPADAWVSVNVSPALATAVVPLVSALELADRSLVFEITEHVEVEDYDALDKALALVRGRARLAVDDAGAGYAGLRHILELRPQFVKLDLSLVRNVDTDRARQAMVAGMAHFAHGSGCELIAEGIETEEELAELIRLGVTYGQGYLFGKPQRVG